MENMKRCDLFVGNLKVSLADRMAATSEDVRESENEEEQVQLVSAVERMGDERVAKKIYDGKVSGKRDGGDIYRGTQYQGYWRKVTQKL